MLEINKVLWAIATIMLLGSGLYFTVKLNFFQFNIKEIIKSLSKQQVSSKGISPFQTLNMSLASRIGVGSLAGVSLSIYYGGIGSIFWMWISALISSTNAFSESLLGVIYRVKDEDNIYQGGPSFYIDKGLGKRTLSILYAVIIIMAYIFGFLTIQANTIVKSLNQVFNINPYLIGAIIAIITFLIIIKGVKSIAAVTTKLVPLMSFIYIIVALYIIIMNITLIPSIIIRIIQAAFNFKSISAGFITTLIIGIQRGIFSNEAGIGSGAVAASVADTNNPVNQGYIQMIGVYFTTLVICTLTALIVILTDYKDLYISNVNGIEITQYAFNYHLGEVGNYLIMISIILFAFSTIITGYFYGESNFKYLFKKLKKSTLFAFKIIVLLILMLGSILSSSAVWKVVDFFVVLMAIINVYALINLRKIVIDEYKFYKAKT